MIPVARARQSDFQICHESFFGAIFHRTKALLYFAVPRHSCFSAQHDLRCSFSERANGPQSMQTDHLWWLHVLVRSSRAQTLMAWAQAVLRSIVKEETALTKISASRFATVLQAIGPPNGRRLEFLRAHYAAPGRAATAATLAERVGYSGDNGITLWYGRLARQIGAFVGEGNPDLSLLVELVRPPTVTNKEWILVMRPEFAVGLKKAGWIED
jgi:hypothetical protein